MVLNAYYLLVLYSGFVFISGLQLVLAGSGSLWFCSDCLVLAGFDWFWFWRNFVGSNLWGSNWFWSLVLVSGFGWFYFSWSTWFGLIVACSSRVWILFFLLVLISLVLSRFGWFWFFSSSLFRWFWVLLFLLFLADLGWFLIHCSNFLWFWILMFLLVLDDLFLHLFSKFSYRHKHWYDTSDGPVLAHRLVPAQDISLLIYQSYSCF